MLEALALVVSALAPPLPMIPPQGCRVSATREHLIVRSQGVEVRHAFAEEEVPFAVPKPEVTALPVPGEKDLLLAGVRESWTGASAAGLGHLYEITCGLTPSIHVVMVAPGIDFGRVAIARDGRWIVGGWGGLRVLDPIGKRLTPLTSPPPYEAPRCWSAEAGKPARAADVPIVDSSTGVFRQPPDGPDEIPFVRGGACGYEAEMLTTAHALILGRGILRTQHSIATFARGDDGRILLGDGDGPCERHTAGAIWWSHEGEAWARAQVRDGGAGVARIVRVAPGGGWLALTGICRTGGGSIGGDLFFSEDLAAWGLVKAIPDGFSDAVDGGAGITELVVADGRTYLAAMQGTHRKWFESTDGRTWAPSGNRYVPKAPQTLAKTLGVGVVNGVAEDPDRELGVDERWALPTGQGQPAPDVGARLPALAGRGLVALLVGCASSAEPPKAAAPVPEGRILPGPSDAICDPNGCAAFCARSACDGGEAACEERCARVCGDGYFDDRDGPIMTCVAAATGDACAALRRCCAIDYTSQLCGSD